MAGSTLRDSRTAVEFDGYPRLVALDIDGTICIEDDPYAYKRIRPAVRAAIDAVVRSPAHVVLATGRLVSATIPFLRELRMTNGIAVCSNGAVAVDAATGEILCQYVFELDDPVTVLRDRLDGAVFVAEDPGVGVRVTGHVDDADTHHGVVRLVDIDDLTATPTTRLAVHWPGHTAGELAGALAEIDLPGIRCWCYPDDSFADLTAAGVSKASTLEKLRIDLGVSANATLVVGDGTNDIEMLAWAAHGVAMGQAGAQVQAAADEVCPPVTEDGLATLLARWFS